MDAVFKALSDPTRRLILDILIEQNDQTLFELNSRLIMDHDVDMSRQAITKHLKILAAAGIVTPTKSGRYTLLHLNTLPLVNTLTPWLRKYQQNKESS